MKMKEKKLKNGKEKEKDCKGCLFYKEDADTCVIFFPVRVVRPDLNIKSCEYWKQNKNL